MNRVWDFLKEVWRSSYDPVTNRIIGANHGSVVWHHENRHREQYIKGWWSILEYVGFHTLWIFSTLFTMTVVGWIPNGYFWACLSWMPFFTVYQFLEFEAWTHAIAIKVKQNPRGTKYAKETKEEKMIEMELAKWRGDIK